MFRPVSDMQGSCRDLQARPIIAHRRIETQAIAAKTAIIAKHIVSNTEATPVPQNNMQTSIHLRSNLAVYFLFQQVNVKK